MAEHFVPQAVVMREMAGVIDAIGEPSQQQLSYLSAFAPETPIPDSVAFGGSDSPEVRQTLLERKLIRESEISGHVQLDAHVALLAQHRLSPDEQEALRQQAQKRYIEQEATPANTPEGWRFYTAAGNHAQHLNVVESSNPKARELWDRITLAHGASGNFKACMDFAETAYNTWEPGQDRAGMAWRRAVNSNYVGRHKEASIWVQDALSEHQQYGGTEEWDLAYRSGLGRALYFLDETPRAQSIFEGLVRECRVKIEQEGATDNNRRALAPMLLNLAQIKFDTGDFYAAYEGCREARMIRESTLGSSHRFTLMDMAREGRSLAYAGEPEAALGLLRPAYEALSGSAGPVHHDTVYARAAVAEALRLSGDETQGNQLASVNFEMAKESWGPDSLIATCAGQVAAQTTVAVRWTI